MLYVVYEFFDVPELLSRVLHSFYNIQTSKLPAFNTVKNTVSRQASDSGHVIIITDNTKCKFSIILFINHIYFNCLAFLFLNIN